MEWISVKDRLPEEGTYLVYDGLVISIATFNYLKEWYALLVMVNSKVEFDMTPTVTHWMPLPEPPKGKERCFECKFFPKCKGMSQVGTKCFKERKEDQ